MSNVCVTEIWVITCNAALATDHVFSRTRRDQPGTARGNNSVSLSDAAVSAVGTAGGLSNHAEPARRLAVGLIGVVNAVQNLVFAQRLDAVHQLV